MKLIRAKDRLNSTLYFVKLELKRTETESVVNFLRFVTYPLFNLFSRDTLMVMFNWFVLDVSIRLQGSSIPNAGRVEVLYAGIWGTISGTNWDINDATVVCRQLGYQAGAEVALANGVYGLVSGPVWITNLQCSGSEANIMSCSHDGIGIKSESQHPRNVASVICKNLSHTNGKWFVALFFQISSKAWQYLCR